jgi:Tol biopolymer transport system component
MMTRVTYDSGVDDFPVWTCDGKRIAFHTDRNGGSIYGEASDGTGKDELLASAQGREIIPFSWSRDGKSLVSMELNLVPIQMDIGLISIEGNYARKLLLQEKYYDCHPQVSPDGRWIAYASNESGKYEVYVRPFPEADKGKSQISTNGGDNPLWSPDGRDLFYRNGDSCMSAGGN